MAQAGGGPQARPPPAAHARGALPPMKCCRPPARVYHVAQGGPGRVSHHRMPNRMQPPLSHPHTASSIVSPQSVGACSFRGAPADRGASRQQQRSALAPCRTHEEREGGRGTGYAGFQRIQRGVGEETVQTRHNAAARAHPAARSPGALEPRHVRRRSSGAGAQGPRPQRAQRAGAAQRRGRGSRATCSLLIGKPAGAGQGRTGRGQQGAAVVRTQGNATACCTLQPATASATAAQAAGPGLVRGRRPAASSTGPRSSLDDQLLVGAGGPAVEGVNGRQRLRGSGAGGRYHLSIRQVCMVRKPGGRACDQRLLRSTHTTQPAWASPTHTATQPASSRSPPLPLALGQAAARPRRTHAPTPPPPLRPAPGRAWRR